MAPAMTKLPLLILLNLILAVHQTRAQSLRSALFKMDGSMSGKVFSELFLFEVQAHTKKICILACLDHGACNAVTVTSSALTSQVTCRGHGSPGQKLTTQSAAVVKADTVFYYKFWLNTACSLDSDCGVVNAQCVTGQCVCRPDYFYSEGQDTCVSSCSEADLQTNYLMYRDRDFSGNDLALVNCTSSLTEQECHMECQRLCNEYVATFKCFNVEFAYTLSHTVKRCMLKKRFPSTNSLTIANGPVFMRRTCI